VPNRPLQFANPGAVLPALRSEQTEVGVKWAPDARLLLSAAAFQITKPFADDRVLPDGRLLRVGGAKEARHQGVELAVAGRVSTQWALQASMAWLDARTTVAVSPALVDRAVANVPRRKASVFADYKVAAVPGLSLNSLLVAESGKAATTIAATPSSVTLPDSWQWDAGLAYRTSLGGKWWTWKVQLENVTNRSYWREAPTQSWGGIYLFAASPRTARLSASIDF
jgi:iron complex outermembrane receptor protein